MAAEYHGIDLLPVITLLAAAVIAAPLFKRPGNPASRYRRRTPEQ